MLKSEVKCENITGNNIIHRASLRGLKKCTSCGHINGQRALICRNVNCDLRIRRLAAIKPFDPIQLVTYGETKLYSLRSKEKLLQPRNFVSITESGTVQSRSCAVCYVDNCKYDAFKATHLVCRHIKACQVMTNVAVSEVYPIDKGVLWNLNIPTEQKQRLWELYQLEEKLIHPVQKLNSSIFVVKCVESNVFPAGRLHITVFSNKVANKSGNFSCSCKKLKIMLESDNSVVMKQEICDHLLLLLSAILNKPEGKTMYSKFLDLLQYLWMPTYLNTPIVDCGSRPSQFMNDYLSLGKCNKTNTKVENTVVTDNSVDIFNFSEEIFAVNNIPDFSDIILNGNDIVPNSEMSSKPKQAIKLEMQIKDPKLNTTVSSINDEEMVLNFTHNDSPYSLATSFDEAKAQTPILFNENGLSVIEQFQLNHNIQVSNDNIDFEKNIESLNSLEYQVIQTKTPFPSCAFKQKSLLKTSCNESNTEEYIAKSCIVIKPTKSTATFPVQKSNFLKQGAVEIIKIAKPIKKLPVKGNCNIVQISRIDTRANLYDYSSKKVVDDCNVLPPTSSKQTDLEYNQINSIRVPSLSYESWLDYIIENLNEKIVIQESPFVECIFHVPEAIFDHFSKTFMFNSKRLPSKTSVVNNQKYKGHIKYTWYFNQVSTVQRIFKTKNMIIELERSYQRLADGSYELYSPPKSIDNNNFRTIYPKIELHKAFIQFTNNNLELHSNNLLPYKNGLKLEWLPSAYPKSNFGLMTIEFCVSVKSSPDGAL